MYVTVHISDCFVHLDKQTLIDKFGCNVKARVGKINKASDVSEHEHKVFFFRLLIFTCVRLGIRQRIANP